MSNITQLHNCSPEELIQSFSKLLDKRIEDLKENFQPKTPEEFLTRKQAVELLGISYGTLHDWANKGILKTLKIGNRTYYSRKAIEETLYNSNK